MLRHAARVILVSALAVSGVRAQVVRPVLVLPEEYASSVSLDDAGTVVYAVSTTNQFGVNPGYLRQIVRWDPTTGIGTPITDFEEGVDSVSVSDDGSWLVFISKADLVGTNHDESPELYVMHPDGTALAQLTSGSFPAFKGRGVHSAVLSGSGNRIAFVGRIDPLGTNPGYTDALFVIDRDGINLRQLHTDVAYASEQLSGTSSTVPFPKLAISDDGTKVVYTLGSPAQFAGINADGTGDHAFSGTSLPGAISISGNGAKVVYTTGFSSSLTAQARTFDGNPATIVTLGPGEQPSITDDASTVYYYRYAATPVVAGVWRVASTGGAQTLIKPDVRAVGISGNGGRIVARGAEIVAFDSAGANTEQLTTTVFPPTFVNDLALSSDGHTAHFVSSFNPLGTNPTHGSEYFSYSLDTGQLWQRTPASLAALPADSTDVSDDGSIVFQSNGDLAGDNPCGAMQVFRLDPAGAYHQLTSCAAGGANSAYPVTRPDGQVIAFAAEVGCCQLHLFSANADGTGKTQLTQSALGSFSLPWGSVAGTGPTSWIAYAYDSVLFRVKADGSSSQLLASGRPVSSPTIAADGSVAWASTHDFGQNPDLSFEVFLFADATQSIRQLSNNDWCCGSPFTGRPVVTQDAQWVFAGMSRFHVASGAHDYVGGSGHTGSFVLGPVPDATGSRWLTWGRDANGAGPSPTIFLADPNAVPAFAIGKASPTVLSWDASPFSLQYDVIRGSIANLSIAGATVSLGPVSCLEDDSPDAHTRGHGDAADPAPGQAFYYLYRGSVGFNAAAGSYGQGSGGKERIAGAGGCNP